MRAVAAKALVLDGSDEEEGADDYTLKVKQGRRVHPRLGYKIAFNKSFELFLLSPKSIPFSCAVFLRSAYLTYQLYRDFA